LTILFDMDGTLIDSTPAILESFDYAFEKMGVRCLEHEKIRSLIGYPLDDIFIKIGVEKSKTGEFVAAYKERYKDVANAKTSLIKGAKEAVELAYSFASLGVVTTKTALYTKDILKHFGLLKFFKAVIGREDVKCPKPHAEPIVKAMNSLNSDKKSCWMIGDTILDMGAAKAAGINGVGVLCGYGKKEDLNALTPYVVNNVLLAVTLIKTFSIK
jgi:phosphoglycolate phosphatase